MQNLADTDCSDHLVKLFMISFWRSDV